MFSLQMESVFIFDRNRWLKIKENSLEEGLKDQKNVFSH
jgi:hypothetical protein